MAIRETEEEKDTEEATENGGRRQTSRTALKTIMAGRTELTAMNLEQQILAMAQRIARKMLMRTVSTSTMAI